MEIDTNVSDILREVIAFLESLQDEQLPLQLESLREKLLERSKNTLSLATMAPSSSPEPYLDMNSGPKSVLLTKNEVDTEEYVGMEASPKQVHQDYYETFEHKSQINAIATTDHPKRNADDQEENQALIGIYKNLSAMQSKMKCHKCGPLYRKEGKKLFMSENRACWIALMGSHLLIYRSERHNRPHAIHPIRGYMARPAPSLLYRDRQKSESAFEMICPGNETLQFIARTPKDMDQWIAKICEVGRGNEDTKSRAKVQEKGDTMTEIPASLHGDDEESRRDAAKSTNKSTESKSKKEAERKDKLGNPPPLPARIPRRLPSLPLDDFVPSYKAAVEDDDDDDIYHKIEDLRKGTPYQNMVLSKKRNNDERNKDIAYNDVSVAEEKKDQIQDKKLDVTPLEETYDDIVMLSRINVEEENRSKSHHSIVDSGNKTEESYDDVENLISNGSSAKDRVKDQTETSNKFLQKKSFLDRVWSRRESSGKSDKRFKGKISSSPPLSLTTDELPAYNDVSDMTPNGRESLMNELNEELPEYNCPPPPRPIHNHDQIEEFYDDVSTYREQCNGSWQIKDNAIELESNDELSREEIEHYQSPKSDLRVHDAEIQQNNEELYDDIALWTDFTARQRDINGKKDNEDSKLTTGSDKKSRNRFAVNRKSRSSEFTEANKRSGNECEEIEDSTENNGLAKRNTFQKLISKMENSLAKVSARSQSSFPASKPTGGTE